jgi:hypothetical protein
MANAAKFEQTAAAPSIQLLHGVLALKTTMAILTAGWPIMPTAAPAVRLGNVIWLSG